MRIVVTGGTGELGAAVVEAFLARGADVPVARTTAYTAGKAAVGA